MECVKWSSNGVCKKCDRLEKFISDTQATVISKREILRRNGRVLSKRGLPFKTGELEHMFIVHVPSHLLMSALHCSCFDFISFSPQFISFTSSTIVHLIHIYVNWLHSYYMVIQFYCQFHFSANLVSGN